MVPSRPEWVGQPILKNNHPDSTQFVQIEYDGQSSGGDKVAKGRYWVRRSSVLPRDSCTSVVIAAGERDTRVGANGAGSFCSSK